MLLGAGCGVDAGHRVTWTVGPSRARPREVGGRRVGLVVDSLQGEFQTVIKPLARMFSRVECIAGSTILGSGEVALILDVAAVSRHAERKPAMLEET